MVHGGGDYTNPDRLEIIVVAVSGGPLADAKKLTPREAVREQTSTKMSAWRADSQTF